MKAALLLVVLLGLLAAAVAFAARVWMALGVVELGGHGWFALSLGAGLTLALGVGLMRLVYFSSRNGYDGD